MGKFSGSYTLRPIGPYLFEYRPNLEDPFRYTTNDGRTIQPPHMETDGATVPRVFWGVKWLGPGDWFNAAVIHDGAYELNHWGYAPCTFAEANRILFESMGDSGVPWLFRWLVWVAVTLFGRGVWNRYEG